MPNVKGWIERKDDRNLYLVAETSLPARLHKPETKLIIHAFWPKAQGRLDEPNVSGTFTETVKESTSAITVSPSIGIPPFAQIGIGISDETSIEQKASQKYSSFSGQVIELSGFSVGVPVHRVYYRIEFPVLNAKGYGRGASLEWKMSYEQEWRRANLEFAQLWEEELDKRLPSSFRCYRGNHELKKKLVLAITKDDGPHSIFLYGPGGVGKTALIRAVLASIDKPPWSLVLGFTAKGEFYDSMERRRRPRESSIRVKRDIYTVLSEDLNTSWDGLDLEVGHRLIRARIEKEPRVLFILDNLESIKEFENLLPLVLGIIEPPPKGIVVVTTRELPERWEEKQKILTINKILCEGLKRLHNEDLKDIVRDTVLDIYGFNSHTIPHDDLDKIVERSDGNPLSAKFFAHAYFSGEKSFLKTNKSRRELLEFCFGIQWRQLKASEKSLLRRLGLMGPNPISEEELVESFSLHYGRRGTRNALNHLRYLSFLEVTPGKNINYISLHSLVREWLEIQ